MGGQPFLSIAATKFNGCYQPEPLLTGGSINKLTIDLESTQYLPTPPFLMWQFLPLIREPILFWQHLVLIKAAI